MKRLFTYLFLTASAAGAFAQTTNLAISNADGTGRVEVYGITELDNASEATLQMWLRPTAWTQATLIGQDNFSLDMGVTEGEFVVSAGDGSATFTADGVVGNWTQLTVTISNGVVRAYVNNNEVSVSGELPATFEPTASALTTPDCVIAEGLHGEMDEIRVWSRALEQEDFFWQNTLNRFNDNYDALAAYWKCDQAGLETNLYDYRCANGSHHHNGVLDGVTKVEVTDNALFRYRVVAGYTNMQRFTDRINIDRDMFLMTNDVIFLAGKLQTDGSVIPEWPDNSCTPTNVDYIEEWEGRTGVMSFNGEGSQMVAGYARVPFNTESATGHEPSQRGTVEGWVYIDEWTEGAEIYSNYASDDECIVVKLGAEADHELIVDLCGTTATLPDKLEVGKWQFVAVYLQPTRGSVGTSRGINPIYIGIGEYDENGEFVSTLHHRMSSSVGAVTVGGNDMTITSVPNFADGSTMTVGKNLKGKIDEFMIWGSDRQNVISTDAVEGYEWNIGVWDNIFLCTYYKGDDPDDIGKDSQSCKAIVQYLSDTYYKNHTGYKFRLGLISGIANEGWHDVLNQEEHVDNFIRDCKELIKDFDGLDVDLEWMNNDEQWAMYNNVVGRLINEVMVDYPEKTLSCSLHGWNWDGFDLDLLSGVDYFTMQIYDWDTIDYERYLLAYNRFNSYGYPDEQLLLSYPTTQRYSGEGGYKDLFDNGYNDDNFDPDLNEWVYGNGVTHYFNGQTLVKQKQQFIIDNDVRGTMYFDMGNDLKVSDYKSLIRAQNEVIASNVDTVVTEINMGPSAVRNVLATRKAELFTAAQDGNTLNVTLADSDTPATLVVYAVDGRSVMQQPLTTKVSTFAIDDIQRGVYLLRVTQGGEKHTVKIAIK